MEGRRLAYYLLLNVLVSACVAGAILFWYDRNYRVTSGPQFVSQPGQSALGSATLAPLSDGAIEIESVIGAGTLEAEAAVVKFNGEGQLDLNGWQLKDSDGNTFTFPFITLYPTGAVRVHAAPGVDTVVDLHWGAGQPVWQSGEEARLFDSQGILRAVYRVP